MTEEQIEYLLALMGQLVSAQERAAQALENIEHNLRTGG